MEGRGSSDDGRSARRTEVHEPLAGALAAMSSSALPFEFSHHTRVQVGAGVWRQALAEVQGFGPEVLLVTGALSLARLDLEAPPAQAARDHGLRWVRFSVPR